MSDTENPLLAKIEQLTNGPGLFPASHFLLGLSLKVAKGMSLQDAVAQIEAENQNVAGKTMGGEWKA